MRCCCVKKCGNEGEYAIMGPTTVFIAEAWNVKMEDFATLYFCEKHLEDAKAVLGLAEKDVENARESVET